MAVFKNPLFHQEPAHPSVIKLHDDLVDIYKVIREAYQENINTAFDRVSRQIGFVVMTTLPVTFSMTGKQGNVALAAENLRGTLFEEAFLKVLDGLPQRVQGKVADGSYKLYLIWYDALKLKLHTDWMEPAHPHQHWLEPAHVAQRATDVAQLSRRMGPGVHEPAHWFDPSFALEGEEKLTISAMDQVYPELRLVERVRAARQVPTLSPGIREPAHYRDLLERLGPQTLERVAGALQLGPGTREPAHYRDLLERLGPQTLERVAGALQLGPGTREPAHYREIFERFDPQTLERVASAIQLSPGIREPAHYRQLLDRFDPQTLDKVVEVLQAIQKLR